MFSIISGTHNSLSSQSSNNKILKTLNQTIESLPRCNEFMYFAKTPSLENSHKTLFKFPINEKQKVTSKSAEAVMQVMYECFRNM